MLKMIARLTDFLLLNALKIDFQLKIDLSSVMPRTDPFVSALAVDLPSGSEVINKPPVMRLSGFFCCYRNYLKKIFIYFLLEIFRRCVIVLID